MIDPNDDWLNLDSSESEDSNFLLQTTSIDDQGEEIDLFKSNDNSSWQFEEKDLEHFNALNEHPVILHSDHAESFVSPNNMSNLNNSLNALTDELKRHRRMGNYDSQDYSDHHEESDHYDDHHDDDYHDDDHHNDDHCEDHDHDGICDEHDDDHDSDDGDDCSCH